MNTTPPRLAQLRAALDGAVHGVAAELARDAPFPWALAVSRLAVCRFGDLPERAVFPEPGSMASVLAGLGPPAGGTAVLAFSDESAVEFLRARRLGQPDVPDGERSVVTDYVQCGASILRALVRGLDADPSDGAGALPPSLREGSMVSTLLATHAPRDTWVLSAQLRLDSESSPLLAYAYVLWDGKSGRRLAEFGGAADGAEPRGLEASQAPR